ncbi:E3 ubiquitin-protein ligase SIRP1-like [Mercurialis annua]|uniref:E3 ubiquitin-protein ligase SIRP1-like n=1 Tax=Mercurialis annua TaxID=3986 RepID=UPI00215E4586|nr:E3 ubiquitin-protein ligase SIRP1-like [Mercurialis annua]
MDQYWCHICCRLVMSAMESEVKCPFCETGFLEQVACNTRNLNGNSQGVDFASERGLSILSPVLLGLMGGLGSSIRAQEHERRGSFNSFNEEGLIILQESENQVGNMTNYFRDYLIGPGLDLLLQNLADNDPNRYGTPPAKKEAVKAMPAVAVEHSSECSVCLEEFEIGSEAKEMGCKHKFHSGCIVPWLELHSSCPVCRFQMDSEDSKIETNNYEGGGSEETDNGMRNWVPVSWPFDELFVLSASENGGSSAAEAETLPTSFSQTDET